MAILKTSRYSTGDYLFCEHTGLFCQYLLTFANKPYVTKPAECLSHTQISVPDLTIVDLKSHSADYIKRFLFGPQLAKYCPILVLEDFEAFNSPENITILPSIKKFTSHPKIQRGIVLNDLYSAEWKTWKRFSSIYNGDRYQLRPAHYLKSSLTKALIDIMFYLFMKEQELGEPHSFYQENNQNDEQEAKQQIQFRDEALKFGERYFQKKTTSSESQIPARAELPEHQTENDRPSKKREPEE